MQQAGSTEAAEQFACQQEQCQQQQRPPLETISHDLLTCPAAARAWQWFAEHVWSRVQQNAGIWVRCPAGCHILHQHIM